MPYRRDDYGSDDEEPVRRSKSTREPRKPRKKTYDDEEYNEYDAPPRGKRSGRDRSEDPMAYGKYPPPPGHGGRSRDYDDYDSAPPPQRHGTTRDAHRRPPPDHYDYEERGYRSEGPPRGGRPDYDSDYDDHARRNSRRDDPYRPSNSRRHRDGSPRLPQEYFHSPTDDYHRSSRRDRSRNRDDYYDYDYDRNPRDRYRDSNRRKSYHDDRDTHAGAGGPLNFKSLTQMAKNMDFKNGNWQKQASEIFMTHAMPMIKKEGTKFVKGQFQSYMRKKGM